MPYTTYDDDQIESTQPGGATPPVPEPTPRVPKELRDEANVGPSGETSPGYLDEEEVETNREVAEVVGTDELPCGIGDTEFPCGVMADEDPDASGGASDVDQGF